MVLFVIIRTLRNTTYFYNYETFQKVIQSIEDVFKQQSGELLKRDGECSALVRATVLRLAVIAVPVTGGRLSSHFGHCEQFALFDVDANEKTILETESVRQHMADNGIVPLKADWTRNDPVITEWLTRFGKAGVPFYLVIPADPEAEPIPLPEVITTDLVINALDRGVAKAD